MGKGVLYRHNGPIQDFLYGAKVRGNFLSLTLSFRILQEILTFRVDLFSAYCTLVQRCGPGYQKYGFSLEFIFP